jgi:hypothetical protein
MSHHADLTMEKLLDVLDSVPRIPWVGFTMNGPAYSALRYQCTEVEAKDPFHRPFGGVEVHCVYQQKAGCLRWGDKELMLKFIELLESGDNLAEGNFMDAAELVEERLWPEIIGD